MAMCHQCDIAEQSSTPFPTDCLTLVCPMYGVRERLKSMDYGVKVPHSEWPIGSRQGSLNCIGKP